MQNQKDFTLKGADSLTLAKFAVATLIEKKALDVRLYYVKEESSITDYYVNASGRSSTQVASLAEEVAYQLGNAGRDAARMEGKRGDTWILVDFIDVIVQVFDSEARNFYDFDRLLAEAEQVDISHIEKELDNEN